MQHPDLSIVVTSRNDGHGGNIRERTQAFADALQYSSSKVGYKTELIVVEWNPPDGAGPLADAIQWPSGPGITTRVITVPANVHSRVASADKIPLFQMLAKNVGIRRATGAFVLATNVDVIISPKLMEEMSPARLHGGTVYRNDRVDVAAEPVLGESDPERRLAACEGYIVGVSCRLANYRRKSPSSFEQVRRELPLAKVRGILVRTRAVIRLALWPSQYRADLRFHWFQLNEELSSRGWHSNACGDFTLMSAQDWISIQGYWEYEGYSMHLDTLGIYAARHAGMRQKMLDEPIFHVDHEGGWSVTAARNGTFSDKLAVNKIPNLPDSYAILHLHDARGSKGPLYTNREDWGFSAENFAEVVLSPEGRRATH